MRIHKRLNSKDLAPRARFELATLRLTAEEVENLNALVGVAYRERQRFSVPQLGYLGYQILDGKGCFGRYSQRDNLFPYF
jgi:hypothetical protein